MVNIEDQALPIGDIIVDPNNYRFQDMPEFVQAAESRVSETSVQERTLARLTSRFHRGRVS